MGLWDNQTTELRDKLQDCGTTGHMMGQWVYGAHYGTALIMGSAVVLLPMGQTMGSWDNGINHRIMGQWDNGTTG